ncbi:MAG: PKD domain-containing protein [Actinobacteria bacterium]|nr:PKD domain-containing protein [Actinomycetota bacterium]
MSATGSSDPDTAAGDGIRNYVWAWGDGTPDTTGTSASQSHAFPTPGTYTVTLRVLDKWGRASAPVTQSVTTAVEPAGNQAPTAVFNQPTCNGRTCPVSSSGSTDTDGGIRNYTWKWGRHLHDHPRGDRQLGQDLAAHQERDGRIGTSAHAVDHGSLPPPGGSPPAGISVAPSRPGRAGVLPPHRLRRGARPRSAAVVW